MIRVHVQVLVLYVLYCTVLYSIAIDIVLYCITLSKTLALCLCAVLYCIALYVYSVVLHCIVLYCVVLYGMLLCCVAILYKRCMYCIKRVWCYSGYVYDE